ncbi:hypothetical protein A3Q56_05696 [Intoshia linei]|uniref:Cilia-and flagella-associated protein 96 n=1 Tax=Intoshia linei TaxID=1819745 RepID=A0A177AXK0_9BILA|nr:hypothetical protein A3Q56_05696 [Intoshia linei]
MADKNFNKSDMERVGYFQEMSYITVNDPYKANNNLQFNSNACKGKQLMTSNSKPISNTQSGYFSKKFDRILEGEAYTDKIKLKRQFRIKEKRKQVGKTFIPNNFEKLRSGVGCYYGTFGGPFKNFSNAMTIKRKNGPELKNIITQPPKKGTGYGYVNVALNKYYDHQPDPYDRANNLYKQEVLAEKSRTKGPPFKLNMHPTDFFDGDVYKGEKMISKTDKNYSLKNFKPFRPSHPSKSSGGCKAGTFNIYPSHSNDKYIDTYKLKLSNKSDRLQKVFMYSSKDKSKNTTSIINKYINRTVNSSNYKTIKPLTIY